MADTTNKELLEQLENMAKSMESIKTDIEPIGLATGLVTKLVQKIVGGVIQQVKAFDAMRISNADLNVNFIKMTDVITDQGVDIGTLTEHSQMQLNLHRIGYKQINKDLREQLVWLDKTDKQGADLVKFMSTLIEKGADVKTQTLIAQEIADVSRHTGQSARAAISAADQMGDQITVLKALGLDDDMLLTVLKAAEEMPQTNAASLGKFVAEMIEPKDITKSILLGTYQSGRDLLRENATVQERVAIIQRAAAEASERAQQFLKQAGPDPFLLKTFKDTFVGSTGILAMQVEAANTLKTATFDFSTDVDNYSDTTDAYKGSFKQLGDSVENIAQGFAIKLLPLLIGDDGLLGKLQSMIPDLKTVTSGLAGFIKWWKDKFGDGEPPPGSTGSTVDPLEVNTGLLTGDLDFHPGGAPISPTGVPLGGAGGGIAMAMLRRMAVREDIKHNQRMQRVKEASQGAPLTSDAMNTTLALKDLGFYTEALKVNTDRTMLVLESVEEHMRNQDEINGWNKSRMRHGNFYGGDFGRDKSIERGQIE